MTIYIVTHKEFDRKYCDDLYRPLLVGAIKNNCSFAEFQDDTGDNISFKNPSFCELTGLYWIWKNTSDDIIGLCHYRRYFTTNRYFMCDFFRLREEKIKKCLQKSDIILPEKNHHEYNEDTVLDNYALLHNIEDWNMMKRIIIRDYPDYLKDVEWFEKENTGYCFNMFIGNKKTIDRYCEWLFDILFSLEEMISTEEYDQYNKRIYGFLAERLINVWVHHNKPRITEIPVYLTEIKLRERVKNKMKWSRNKIRIQ